MQRSLWIKSPVSYTSECSEHFGFRADKAEENSLITFQFKGTGRPALPSVLPCCLYSFHRVTPEFSVRGSHKSCSSWKSCQWKEAHDINPGPKESAISSWNQTNYFNLLLWNKTQVQKTTQNKYNFTAYYKRRTDCTVIGTRVKKQTPSCVLSQSLNSLLPWEMTSFPLLWWHILVPYSFSTSLSHTWRIPQFGLGHFKNMICLLISFPLWFFHSFQFTYNVSGKESHRALELSNWNWAIEKKKKRQK